MNRLLDCIVQKVIWKIALLFAFLFGVFYLLINFSGFGVAGLLEVTGGASILDFEFGFTYEKALAMLGALGADGRSFYLTKIIPLDFLFPLSYMLCYSSLIALLLKYTSLRKPGIYLLMFPVLGMLCDWTENIGIIVMLNSYPNLHEWVVSLTSTAGIIKAVLSVGNLLIIAMLLLLALRKRLLKTVFL